MSNTNETNNKNFKRKFKIVKAIMISIIIIAIISLTGIGFAKYITSLKGSSEVQIAKWNFKVTAGSSENLTIDLAQTRYENDTTEVDKTKVAPGTKGEIVFNIDGNDSQVSLEYDINMSLTQIPENLIFYTDEQMTNAVYKDNGEMHLNGYFGVDNENKKETKTLYWQWKLETGTTQEEIENNDVLDSKWMDRDIILGINAVGRQVADESSTTKCEVTFNLNGGSLANYDGVNLITKKVEYGKMYGELPVPVREGYIFKGWTNAIGYPKTTASAWVTPLVSNSFVVSNFDANTKYNVEYDIELNEKIPDGYIATQTDQWGGLLLRTERKDNEGYDYEGIYGPLYEKCGNDYNIGDKYHIKGNIYCKDISTAVIIWYTGRCQKDINETFKNYKVLKGTISNIYFYKEDILLKNVTSNTMVQIKNNHTLRAIWEKI